MITEKEKEAIKNAKEEFKRTTFLSDIGHRDLGILLNLITKLQEENKKKDKAIDLIIQHILLGKTFMQEVCPNTTVNNCNNFRKNGGCNECIKQYFINKVEAEDE